MALKKRYRILLILALLVFLLLVLFVIAIWVSPPDIDDKSALQQEREKLEDGSYRLGQNWSRKNKFGIWEVYVKGKAFERGVAKGYLCKEILEDQETAFIDGIKELVPSNFMLHFLKYVVAWENRNLPEYISDELKKEIYGMSHFASDKYDYVGPKYHRKLFYHSAHDIGHTVQNMGLVGCSSFSAWGSLTENGQILTGRNFDFYIGDEFRVNKVLFLVDPEEGYKYASFSWPGMSGVLSGMNEKGLTVSLNAGPPEIPNAAKTPVSILAREIIQYAANIEDAIAIAKSRDIFVSESFMISSVADGRTIVIEKSPEKMGIVETDNDMLISTNHFQSDVFKDMESNIEFQEISSTKRRFDRINFLTSDDDTIVQQEIIDVLRDLGDLDKPKIGIGNEENINIMVTHHSILFEPADSIMWISVGDSPIGEYVCFDLKDFFNNTDTFKSQTSLNENIIPASAWINSKEFKAYQTFHSKYVALEDRILNGENILKNTFDDMISYNPDFYKGYMMAGEYFYNRKECTVANKYLSEALKLVIPWQKDIDGMESALKKCR